MYREGGRTHTNDETKGGVDETGTSGTTQRVDVHYEPPLPPGYLRVRYRYASRGVDEEGPCWPMPLTFGFSALARTRTLRQSVSIGAFLVLTSELAICAQFLLFFNQGGNKERNCGGRTRPTHMRTSNQSKNDRSSV